MSLFDSASLVVTPNGVKEGKLYSIKPTDGSGDLSVTRATTATRVNSAGLVELVPYNLLTYSEALTPNYTFNQCSITSNQTGPNGVNNAKRITNGATATDVYFEQSIGITNNVYTWSVYVKKGTDTAATIKPVHVGIGGDVSLMTFTFSTETITTAGAITTSGFTKLSNGWYRIYCSVPITSSVVSLRGRFGNTNTPNVYNDWFGAQLVTGSSAKDYQKTETRLNIPRLDYTNGTCPSILVEPQRTNITLQSENLGTTWYTAGGALTLNATTAPDGNTNADKIKADTSTGVHVYQQTLTVSNATVYTMSVYVKAAEYTYFELADTSSLKGQTFNLTAKTISAPQTAGVGAATSSKITDVGNGWLRCSITYTTSSTTGLFRISLSNGTSTTFTGDNTSGLFAWGAQLEAGSYATSYIPTVASSVTRNADLINKTGIGGFFGTNKGTIFCDFIASKIDTTSQYVFDLSDGVNSGTNRFAFYKIAAGTYELYTNTATGVTINTNTRNKLAITWNGSTVKIYANGALKSTITYANANPTKINLGTRFNNVEIGNVNYNLVTAFATDLTNDECITLTTI
jgi:hypothetical protein